MLHRIQVFSAPNTLQLKKNALWKIITNTERVINIRCKKTQNKIHINILTIIHHCKTFPLFQWPYHRTCANNTLLLTTVTVSLNFKKLSFFLQNEKPVTIIILLCRIFKKKSFLYFRLKQFIVHAFRGSFNLIA